VARGGPLPDAQAGGITTRRAGAFGLVLFLSVGVACQPDEPRPLRPEVAVESPTSTKTRVIGLVATTTGEDSWRGDEAYEGASAALQILNRSLEPNEPRFELVTRDDMGDPQRARTLVEEVAGSVQTVGVVYAGPPEVLPQVEETLAAARIPALLTAGDLYSAQLLSRHVFQVSPPYLWQARTIARYLLLDRGYSRIGLISEDSVSGEAARRSLTTALGELGGRVTASSVFAGGEEDTRSALRPLERKGVHAIVVQGPPSTFERVLDHQRNVGDTYTTTRVARRRGSWAPQIVGFDSAISPDVDAEILTPGAVASDSYARGAYYLPIPSFERFRERFTGWWDSPPLGNERRAFEAVQMIGWAARRVPTGKNTDIAGVLEKLRGERFGGLPVTFGPDDHTSVDQTTIGLWVVPRPGIPVREKDSARASLLPWVPLHRGFSIDGDRTSIFPEDWKWMFRNAPPKKAPAPKIPTAKFGVTTRRSDPVH
jgi:ABC-type branched-subunit amino acid transport system substrate-binding protein